MKKNQRLKIKENLEEQMENICNAEKTILKNIFDLKNGIEEKVSQEELNDLYSEYTNMTLLQDVSYSQYIQQQKKLKRKIKYYNDQDQYQIKKRIKKNEEYEQILDQFIEPFEQKETILEIQKIKDKEKKQFFIQQYLKIQEISDDEKIKYMHQLEMQIKIQQINDSENQPTIDRIELIKKLKEQLNNDLYGMDEIKHQLVLLFSQKLRLQSFGGNILLQSSPGQGKTTISQIISKVLDIPFIFISLAGMNDQYVLTGQDFTYIGSQPGMICREMSKHKSQSFVFLFDEVDKCGDKVQNVLMQITDKQQNNKFRDNYIQYPVDLSKSIMIFTCNFKDQINPILLNRMEYFTLKDYDRSEKIKILKGYSNQKISQRLNVQKIEFDDEIYQYIMNLKNESGMRFYEQKMEKIYLQYYYDIEIEGKQVQKVNLHYVKGFLQKETENYIISSLYL